ncbi:hypothetical protein WMY93_027171 [Mugilogobius chulae]|uniref:L1 transposable element RRM domain-containing protein n=1 Tax=Mugilogobius chulae TaxID=88201 RepID=A0AAW0MS62_9GOBI
MNLRSGSKTQHFNTKKKAKKSHAPNKATMDVSTLEESLKSMLTDFKTDLSKQIEGIRTDFGNISTEMKQIRHDVKEIRHSQKVAETSIGEAQERIRLLEERECVNTSMLLKLTKEHKEMSEKVEYLENKSRQNNIRIYGVKEGLEGNDPVGFITSLLTEKLDIPPEMIQIAAAHRSLGQGSASGEAVPRSLVVRFIQWNTRQKVLHAAWSKKDIRIGESRIYFNQDFSNTIQKKEADTLK